LFEFPTSGGVLPLADLVTMGYRDDIFSTDHAGLFILALLLCGFTISFIVDILIVVRSVFLPRLFID